MSESDVCRRHILTYKQIILEVYGIKTEIIKICIFYRRQILTSKDGSRSERIKKILMSRPIT